MESADRPRIEKAVSAPGPSDRQKPRKASLCDVKHTRLEEGRKEWADKMCKFRNRRQEPSSTGVAA